MSDKMKIRVVVTGKDGRVNTGTTVVSTMIASVLKEQGFEVSLAGSITEQEVAYYGAMTKNQDPAIRHFLTEAIEINKVELVEGSDRATASPGAPSLAWELMGGLVTGKGPESSFPSYRAKVPGGWLVRGYSGQTSISFYPDPSHSWT